MLVPKKLLINFKCFSKKSIVCFYSLIFFLNTCLKYILHIHLSVAYSFVIVTLEEITKFEHLEDVPFVRIFFFLAVNIRIRD